MSINPMNNNHGRIANIRLLFAVLAVVPLVVIFLLFSYNTGLFIQANNEVIIQQDLTQIIENIVNAGRESSEIKYFEEDDSKTWIFNDTDNTAVVFFELTETLEISTSPDAYTHIKDFGIVEFDGVDRLYEISVTGRRDLAELSIDTIVKLRN